MASLCKKEPVIMALDEEKQEKREEPPNAVIFVQNTCESELATEVRKMVQSLKHLTGLNGKIVEWACDKLMDFFYANQ